MDSPQDVKHAPYCATVKFGKPGDIWGYACTCGANVVPPTDTAKEDSLPQDVKLSPLAFIGLELLKVFAFNTGRQDEADAIIAHIDTQARRIGEVEADSATLQAVRKEWMDAHEIMGRHPKGPLCAMEELRDKERKRAEAAEARVQELEATLARIMATPSAPCRFCGNAEKGKCVGMDTICSRMGWPHHSDKRQVDNWTAPAGWGV